MSDSSQDEQRRILVTGGAGFIGSHTSIVLLQKGFHVTVVDNYNNSSPLAIERVEQIVGNDKHVEFHELDITDAVALRAMLAAQPRPFDACIHFAAFKAVGESVDIPLEYYRNNVAGTVTLLQALEAHGCTNVVFSSSCTVYGDPATVPITEDMPIGACTNAYGRSKYMMEEVMGDVTRGKVQEGNKPWKIVILRYFNPVGAHESGLIGEDPNGTPTNLMPYITQVAVGKRPHVNVLGNDYDTVDGTGVRDYIHVMDLAEGHVAALQGCAFNAAAAAGCHVFNLGSGKGSSVLEMIAAVSKASGVDIKYEIAGRRAGDIAAAYADPAKATTQLQWSTSRGIDRMCEDSWRWQKHNPDGFKTAAPTTPEWTPTPL